MLRVELHISVQMPVAIVITGSLMMLHVLQTLKAPLDRRGKTFFIVDGES